MAHMITRYYPTEITLFKYTVFFLKEFIMFQIFTNRNSRYKKIKISERGVG